MVKRQRNRRRLPEGTFQATIESLTHDGRGVAHVDGKVVFIEGALPGERVMFAYTDWRRDFAAGRVESLLSRAPDRTEPHCPHYGLCGGCSLQHLEPGAQIQAKQALLQEQFQRIGKLDAVELWPALEGPHWHYRRKARLGVKFVQKKGRVLVGFRERGRGFLADLQQCPVLDRSIAERLSDLAALVSTLTIKEQVPQIEVAVGDHRAVLVFRVLAEPTASDLGKLADFGSRHGFDIRLQPAGPDSVVGLDGGVPALLSYVLPESGLEFQFQATEFTQVNADINRKMVARVLEVLAPSRDDRILDLFCGIGNFTLPLATRAGFVVGVEGCQPLVERARANAISNGLDNVTFYAADLSQELEDQPWSSQRYDKILLDPSRAGAQELMAVLSRWDARRIVYVSCNPSTLARDAGILVHQLGYRLLRAGVMDMFPHTAHVESIALFER